MGSGFLHKPVYCLFSLQSVLFLISLLCVLLLLNEDLICLSLTVEGDEWFGVLSGRDHDMQVSVQGRFREHSQFWIEELKPSSFVHDIVTTGYWLPFLIYPDNVVKANHNSAIVYTLWFCAGSSWELGVHVVECVMS